LYFRCYLQATPRNFAPHRPAATARAYDKEARPTMTFQKGQSGNPLGRPRGARDKLTLLAESLFERDAGAIVGKLIEVAKTGDVGALRLRPHPPAQRDRTVAIELPPMTTAADAVAAMIMQAIGAGDLGAREAGELTMWSPGSRRRSRPRNWKAGWTTSRRRLRR
jgi:hypothetical protein